MGKTKWGKPTSSSKAVGPKQRWAKLSPQSTAELPGEPPGSHVLSQSKRKFLLLFEKPHDYM